MKRFAVPRWAYIELPRSGRMKVLVKEIQPTGMWVVTSESFAGLDFRANLRIVFPNAEGALGFSVEIVCQGAAGIGVELSRDSDALTKSVLLAWSKGQDAEIPSSIDDARRDAARGYEATEDLPHFHERTRPVVPAAEQLRGARVLVIDDDAGVTKFMKSGLTRMGGTVSVANDGEKGLELALSEKFDAVLLDWMLPKLNGEDVLAAIREQNHDLPIAVVSGIVHSGAMRTAVRNMGADEVFAKPFELKKLTAWLARAVRVA